MKCLGSTDGTGTIVDTVLRSQSSMNESPTEVSKYHAIVTPSVRYSTMQCSARLSPGQVQALIVSKLIKKRRQSLGAEDGAKVFVLNNVYHDVYCGSLRFIIENLVSIFFL
jgi:hypothetical protein